MSYLAVQDEVVHLLKKQDILKSLSNLMTNQDFKKVFLDYYLKEYPTELVMLRNNLNLTKEEEVTITRQMDSVALFKNFLDNQLVEVDSIATQIAETIHLRDTIQREK